MDKLSPQAREWDDALDSYNKIANSLYETLKDMRHINDETLEAYRQARNNLSFAHNNFISHFQTND